jgi:hypothetical protein
MADGWSNRALYLKRVKGIDYVDLYFRTKAGCAG